MDENVRLQQYCTVLQQAGFTGDIDRSLATRLVLATDNSVYQVMPALVLFPKTQPDLATIFKAAAVEAFRSLSFTVRGGGTSTNGQSLTPGILIDCSRYLTDILEINVAEQSVWVEPGVVLDQLNATLKPLGYFFPVSISPSSRATLGGMVNTNACGKGSTFYGRMVDRVLEAEWVLTNGESFRSKRVRCAQAAEDPRVAQIAATVRTYQREIAALYPTLPRPLTGYGLSEVWDEPADTLNLNAILVGSEGTLATCSRVKLRVEKIPRCKSLCVIRYADFKTALEDAVHLSTVTPVAIETIDKTILNAAKNDRIYPLVRQFIEVADQTVAALTLVEFVGECESTLAHQCSRAFALLDTHPEVSRLAKVVVSDQENIAKLWTLRKNSVGLLAKTKSNRIPVSGVEDTLVSPEQLPRYVAEFRALLDDLQVAYGMFGHLDAGCLHVRPALDLNHPQDLALYYDLSDKVATLVAKYKGVMWGEHGKGFRSQYVPETFGPVLYSELCRIKAAFDPYNQLNPGKIAVPFGTHAQLIPLNVPPTRGAFTRQIESGLARQYAALLQCNGNAACFNVAVKEVMCPSYKVTADRIHSPKGRAMLLREWLRVRSVSDIAQQQEIEKVVYQALQGCLGCAACKTQCPVNVNIPEFKAKFLAEYFKKNRRTVRDVVTAFSERIALKQSQYPRIFNFLTHNILAKYFINNQLRLENLPRLSVPNLNRLATMSNLKLYTAAQIMKKRAENAVVVVLDWVTVCYEAPLIISVHELLTRLGFNVFLLQNLEQGESFKQQGDMKRFKKITGKMITQLQNLHELNFPLVGLEPSLTLAFNAACRQNSIKLELIQQWLVNQSLLEINRARPAQEIILFLHCMEQSDSVLHAEAWRTLFNKLGLSLTVIQAGCCGMAGLYGHEREHVKQSKKLYVLSWQQEVTPERVILATGYSCRSQIRLLSKAQPLHPLMYLNTLSAELTYK